MNIDRYRWTPEEKLAVFLKLSEDDAVRPQEDEQVGLVKMSETIGDAIKVMQEGDKLVGLSTGYDSIDELNHGMAPGELIVIFGHTNHGKSLFAQNITVNLAKQGVPTMFVGLEMSRAENTSRFMNIYGFKDIQTDITGKANEFVALPIIYPKVDDIDFRQVDGMVAQGVKEGVKLVVLDHLHYFSRGGENENGEIGMLVNEFKKVARRNNVVLILISHIVKLDEDISPKPIHLRGSSFIAQDADQLLSVYRDPEGEQHQLHVKIHKNRNRKWDRSNNGRTLTIVDGVRLVDSLGFKAHL